MKIVMRHLTVQFAFKVSKIGELCNFILRQNKKVSIKNMKNVTNVGKNSIIRYIFNNIKEEFMGNFDIFKRQTISFGYFHANKLITLTFYIYSTAEIHFLFCFQVVLENHDASGFRKSRPWPYSCKNTSQFGFKIPCAL